MVVVKSSNTGIAAARSGQGRIPQKARNEDATLQRPLADEGPALCRLRPRPRQDYRRKTLSWYSENDKNMCEMFKAHRSTPHTKRRNAKRKKDKCVEEESSKLPRKATSTQEDQDDEEPLLAHTAAISQPSRRPLTQSSAYRSEAVPTASQHEHRQQPNASEEEDVQVVGSDNEYTVRFTTSAASQNDSPSGIGTSPLHAASAVTTQSGFNYGSQAEAIDRLEMLELQMLLKQGRLRRE